MMTDLEERLTTECSQLLVERDQLKGRIEGLEMKKGSYQRDLRLATAMLADIMEAMFGGAGVEDTKMFGEIPFLLSMQHSGWVVAPTTKEAQKCKTFTEWSAKQQIKFVENNPQINDSSKNHEIKLITERLDEWHCWIDSLVEMREENK